MRFERKRRRIGDSLTIFGNLDCRRSESMQERLRIEIMNVLARDNGLRSTKERKVYPDEGVRVGFHKERRRN